MPAVAFDSPLPPSSSSLGPSRVRRRQHSAAQVAPIITALSPVTLDDKYTHDNRYPHDDTHVERDSSDSPDCLSPRTLYAQSFDRPNSSRSLPGTAPGRPYKRKNMVDVTGFGSVEEADFDALPVAVQRKYFSTLERLRLAQQHQLAQKSPTASPHDLPLQRHRRGSSLADRRGVTVAPVLEPRRSNSRANKLRKVSRPHSVSSQEISWFLTLPEAIQRKHFTMEEQLALAGPRPDASAPREAVLLDAADEAVFYKTRRTSRYLAARHGPASPASIESAELSPTTVPEGHASLTAGLFDGFRWMDDEGDLDLRLALDDYHANLDGAILPTDDSARRPSFRRHVSVSQTPFGRNSMSSLHGRSMSVSEPRAAHHRQASRAFSLSPRHDKNVSVASIDPNATHYQDPEARLKLRVYLASPQKFDEAIEFGFPSMDEGGAKMDGGDKENRPPKRSHDYGKYSTEKGHSFLDDDVASLFQDDASMLDPDSPLTPMNMDMAFHPAPRPTTFNPNLAKRSLSYDVSSGSTRPILAKHAETYVHAMPGSREMTLRMTLTRPDLRSDEHALYGWQSKNSSNEEKLALEEEENKNWMKGPYGGSDGWGPEKENGVVKRFWNRVRRG